MSDSMVVVVLWSGFGVLAVSLGGLLVWAIGYKDDE